jgi:hypothetical protein
MQVYYFTVFQMVGSCSRDGGSVKTASIGGDTSQGLVVMYASSPAKM